MPIIVWGDKEFQELVNIYVFRYMSTKVLIALKRY